MIADIGNLKETYNLAESVDLRQALLASVTSSMNLRKRRESIRGIRESIEKDQMYCRRDCFGGSVSISQCKAFTSTLEKGFDVMEKGIDDCIEESDDCLQAVLSVIVSRPAGVQRELLGKSYSISPDELDVWCIDIMRDKLDDEVTPHNGSHENLSVFLTMVDSSLTAGGYAV
jgi:hypothetical protein